MTAYIVHLGTGTILMAQDDVVVIDTDDLTDEERDALGDEMDWDKDFADIAERKGTDIMRMIGHYAGERKSSKDRTKGETQ